MSSAKFSKLKATLAGIALLTAAVNLSGCSNPLESEEPFATGGVAIESTEVDCAAKQGDSPASVSREVGVVLAPSDTFVRFPNAIDSATADLTSLLNKDGAQVATVLADGSPQQRALGWVDFSKAVFEADREKSLNRALGKIRITYSCSVMSREQNQTAIKTTPGADYLAALAMTAGTFTHPGSERSIVVLGNGLQDLGQVDLTKGLPQDSSAAKSVADTLKAAGALPDLTGVKVYWFGLGQVDGVKQKPLHPIASKALETLWTELIKAAGGELVKVVKTIPYADPVSTSVQAKAIEVPAPPCVFMLTSDDGFNFKPDSADFLDAAKAKQGADNMAAEIAKSNCSGPLYVVGYAASGVDKRDYNAAAAAKVKSISATRAIAFKGLLEKAGVAIKLVPVGAGKGPTNDWDLSGKFIEEMGKQNRFVEITQSKPEGN